MRLRTLLLMLCIVHVAAGGASCVKGNIKEAATVKEGDFKDNTKKLTCKNGKQIEVNGNRYDELECKPNGWLHKGAELTPKVLADAELNIVCKVKACDKSLITGAPAAEYDYNAGTKELTCKSPKQISIGSAKYNKLKCDEGLGWLDPTVALVPPKKAIDNLQIQCTDPAPPPIQKCALSYIQTPAAAEIDYVNKKLTCKDANKGLEVDGSDQNLYMDLTCNDNTGWAPAGKPSGQNINVKCVAKACHKSLMLPLLTDAKLVFEAQTRLKCTTAPLEELEYTEGAVKKISALLTCDAPSNKWKADGGVDTTLPTDAPIAVTCVPKACHSALISGSATKVAGAGSALAEIKCTDPEELSIGGTRYKALTCKADKWFVSSDASETKVKGSDEAFKADCVAPAATCTYQQAAAVVPTDVVHDGTTNTVVCNAGVPAEIEFNAKTKDCEGFKLTCDTTNGWSTATETSLVPATTKLDVTKYEKYCATTANVQYKQSADKSHYAVTCKDGANYVLNYDDGAGNTKPAKELTCSKTAGWKAGDVVLGQATTPLQLQCTIDVCGNIQKPKGEDQGTSDADASKSDQWEDGLTKLAKRVTVDGGKIQFECVNNAIAAENNAIKLNGKLVNSHLRCDPGVGYTDVDGTAIQPALTASDQVKISCVKSPCGKPAATICNGFAPNKLPEGYKCLEPAFAMTDDPNRLNCNLNKPAKLNKIYIMKEGEESKYHDGTQLVCKEGYHWYKYGDVEQKNVFADGMQLVCVRRKCNNCDKLNPITGQQESVFAEGTADECAKSTCSGAAKFWKIKRVGATDEEEYAGEVTCSSDDANDKKWLIDEKTPIEEGSCIAAISTCTVAAKLETACQQHWTADAGCVELALADTGDVVCPTDSKMFYMARGEFDLKEGATSIKCDLTAGLWKVTTDGGVVDLKRGDTVVCATSNPYPVTTMTTEKPKPCSLCPGQPEFNLTCGATCDDKKTVVLKDSADMDTCETYLEYSNSPKFQTEKEGVVEGNLVCAAAEGVWKTKDGKEVGKFSAFKEPKSEDDEGALFVIVGGAIGGIAVLIIVFIVIFKVCISKRKPAETEKDEETKRRMLEEGKKRKKMRGENDEILDEVSVDAPSELKL